MKIIAIEGPIASGKSTLMESLPAEMEKLTGDKWVTLKEPVDSDPEFHRLLKQFIENPTDANKRAEFQLYVTRTRHKQLQGLPDGNYIIERSLYSDLVFTQCNMISTEGPTGEYQAAYYDIKDHFKTYPQVDEVLYLNRDAHACMQSANDRSRDGEGGYQVEYFQDLELFHMAVLPQACRMYGASYKQIDLGTSFPDPKTIALSLI